MAIKKATEYLPLLVKLLRKEKKYYLAVIILSVFLSLISLAIPVSVQSLVNTVTFGILLQPIVVLSFLLLFTLGINVFLNALLYRALEFFQQHFFAKTSINIIQNILNANISKLAKFNLNNLSHRYYDIMTVQKSMTSILSDGVFIFLQLFAGMILISLYHPYFLIFDLIIIISLILIWKLFINSAVQTAIKESYAKYNMGGWISEICKSHEIFKRSQNFVIKKTENLTNEYLDSRSKHFRFLFTQIIALFVLYAVLSSFVLGVGGFLVVTGELSMGQLVAAELIVTLILTSLTKLGKILENFYDLVAALDKLGAFLGLEKNDPNIIVSNRTELSSVQIKDETHKSYNYNYILEDKVSYFIKGKNELKIENFYKLLQGKHNIQSGQFHIKCPKKNCHPNSIILSAFYTIKKPHMFEGSVLENITMGENVEQAEVLSLISEIGLDSEISSLKEGINSNVFGSFSELNLSSRTKVIILRAIIQKPLYIVFGESFRVFSKDERNKILKLLNQHSINAIVFGEFSSLTETDNFKCLEMN